MATGNAVGMPAWALLNMACVPLSLAFAFVTVLSWVGVIPR